MDIDNALNNLKIDSAGRIRGKNKVIDTIHRQHLKDVDNALMDVRIFVARISTANSTTAALKMIDEFIYKKQVS